MFCRGISSFVALAVMIALATVVALHIYIKSIDIYTVVKPRAIHVHEHAVCYNLSNYRVVVDDVEVCRYSDSPRYFCVFRFYRPINLTIVFDEYVDHLYIDDKCIVFLDKLPLYIYSSSNNVFVVFEVKVYEPWSK
ncbi:MAG: hypothetical protein QW135_06220 [Ignisphaera sp.]